MRLKKLIIGDIKFQWKYGFYFLYVLLTIFYILGLSLLKGNVKQITSLVMILSDPATMGMFFMGAIVLLEKSQRVLNSIAVSPVTPQEYILSKVCSIGIIATVTGICIAVAGGNDHIIWTIIAVFLGSALFSLCGLIVGTNIGSLNQYVIATMPFELAGFGPVIAYLFGSKHILITIQPCVIMFRMMQGDLNRMWIFIPVLMVWIMLAYVFALRSTRRMLKRVGGVRL